MEAKSTDVLYMEDDIGLARLFQKKLAHKGYRVDIAADGEEGIRLFGEGRYDLVVVNQDIPIYSGLEVIRILSSRENSPPAIIITGPGEEEVFIKAMKLGATDYIVKDLDEGYLELMPHVVERAINHDRLTRQKKRAEIQLRESERRYREHVESIGDIIYVLDGQRNFVFVNRALEEISGKSNQELIRSSFHKIVTEDSVRTLKDIIRAQKGGLQVDAFEIAFRNKGNKERIFEIRETIVSRKNRIEEIHGIGRDITDRKRVQEELHRSLEQIQRTFDGVVTALVMAIESRDPYTAGHQQRVARLAGAIAHRMEFSYDRIGDIRWAALLHDIGKIYVPTEILNKPGDLSDAETAILRTHPEKGYDILKVVPFVRPIAQIVRQHHESLDGTGYPHGLSGDQILPEALILRVADITESITNQRPYRPARGTDDAIRELMKYRGTLYDSTAVDCCVTIIRARGAKLWK